MMLVNRERISLQDIIGKGYATFWNFKGDEVILMGSKGSKKSKTIALRWMYLLKKYPRACLLVMRATGKTLRDSVAADLKWAAKRLKLDSEWDFNKTPLEATNKKTGQKIFFRGLDDWQKIASITIDDPNLVLCWSWFEEAFEIDEEETYRNVKLSIRGELPDGYFNQSVASFNPWNEHHFIVKKITDKLTPNELILSTKGKQELIVEEEQEFEFKGKMTKEKVTQLLMITNYKLNEFLDVKDYAKYEKLKKEDPVAYKTTGLGMPGISKGHYFSEFNKQIHVVKPFVIPKHWKRYVAIDYGLDMFAVLWFARDTEGNAYAYNEIHKSDFIISEAAKKFIEINDDGDYEYIFAPRDLWNRRQETGKSVADIFYENGLMLTKTSVDRVDGWLATKEWLKVITAKNIETGDLIQTSKLKIFDNCINLIKNLPQAQKDEKDPNDVATEPHEITHILDALRYFCVNFTYSSEKQAEKQEKLPYALRTEEDIDEGQGMIVW